MENMLHNRRVVEKTLTYGGKADLLLTDNEWLAVSQLIKLLCPFQQVTEHVQVKSSMCVCQLILTLAHTFIYYLS